MAKRRPLSTMEDSSRDFLIKPKKQFEKELIERINKGDELLNRPVNNESEYGQLTSDQNFWHDYNCELLRGAFNKTNNQYFKEYTWSPSMYVSSMFESAPTFKEQIQSTKNDVSKYLTRLQKIREKLNLIEELPGLSSSMTDEKDIQNEGLIYLEKVFSKFHRAAQSLRHRHSDRDTLIIKDEYDLQDLLRALLHIHFEDIREEDYSPSWAGGNSRIDFVLKNEKIVVETKMTNDHLRDKEVGAQLLIDIGKYRAHPDCNILVVLVYDKGDYIRNKAGLKKDLEKMGTTENKIIVFIEPR